MQTTFSGARTNRQNTPLYRDTLTHTIVQCGNQSCLPEQRYVEEISQLCEIELYVLKHNNSNQFHLTTF